MTLTLNDFKTGAIQVAGNMIGYRYMGAGPAVVLVHGALQSSFNFTELGKALAGHYTVYIPDRRGRGLSGPYGEKDDLLTEAGDIVALVVHVGAERIFGLSSGAIVTLQAAVQCATLKKVALYEPPIPLRDNTFEKMDRDYAAAMAAGNMGKAFLAIIKGTADNAVFNLVPGFILAPLLNVMIKAQAKHTPVNELALQHVIPTFVRDRNIARQSPGLLAAVASMKASVLLLGGSKSQQYLKDAIVALMAVRPSAKHVVLAGQGHLAPDNNGSPKMVARELIGFFG